MLFSNQRRHSLSLPAKDAGGKPATVAFLIDHLCQTTMKDARKELFVLDNHLYVSQGMACWPVMSGPVIATPSWAAVPSLAPNGRSRRIADEGQR